MQELDHARIRAKDRYDIDLTEKLHDELVRRIQTGKEWFVTKKGHRSLWRILIQGKPTIIVYDTDAKCIVTLLKHEWWERELYKY